MKKILVIILICVSTSANAQTISGISGVVSNGNQITISGSGFGNNGPTVILFDDFEGGTNGNQLSTNLAPTGEWTRVQGGTQSAGTYTSYSNVSSVSGSLAARFDITTYNSSTEYHPCLVKEDITAFDSFYISYWIYLPDGDTFSGCPAACNWKTVWVCSSDACNDADVTIAATGTGSWVMFGNDFPSIDYFGFTFSNGTWYRFSWWVKGRTDETGENVLAITNTSTANPDGLIMDGIPTLNSSDTNKRDFVSVNGYVRTTANSHPMFDDVYIATGEYAQARVEIGNAETYSSCTSIGQCIVSSWGDTRIVCTVRDGGISAGNAWLYVFDSDRNMSDGYLVTIGAVIQATAAGITFSGCALH